MYEAPRSSVLSLLALREVRAYLRRSRAVAMTVFLGLVYALGSMTLGGMLVLTHVRGGYTTEILWGAGSGQGSWNYPALLIVAPWGVVSLPWFATWATILVSIGVAIGMSVAVLLTVQLVRQRRSTTRGPTAIGSMAGLTPAMLALVTLGACCGTTAAATAGVGVVAQISGTSTTHLLVNNWFLGVFQVAVVWIALLAQELLLRVYGDIIGISGRTTASSDPVYRPPPMDRRFLVGSLARVGLLVAGVTWGLAMLVAWTNQPPGSASAAQWSAWILQYELVALLAVLAALFPREIARWFAGGAPHVLTRSFRGVLLLAGLSLVTWVPPPLAGWGIEGLGNELLFLLGAPSTWGAIAPVFGPGLALYARWGLQYLVLGGFAAAVGLVPATALRPLLWTVGRPGTAGETTPAEDPYARPNSRLGLPTGSTSVGSSPAGETGSSSAAAPAR